VAGFASEDSDSLPGFIHDTFSANAHPLFSAGPVFAELAKPNLREHGLR